MYILDTCVIRELIEHITFDMFPEVWESIEEKLEAGLVSSVREAYRELEKHFGSKNPQMDWVKNNKHIFTTPTNAELEVVRDIYKNKHFCSNVSNKHILRGAPVADAFIIAKAKILDAYVVTKEIYKPNASKIPNICEKFNVKYMDFTSFVKIIRGISS